jgi:hypothetical protein
MGADLRSMSTEVVYSILIFIVVISFLQWIGKGFYEKSLLPPEHIPTTLMFTASAPVLYRVVRHIIKSKKAFKHHVDEEYRGQPPPKPLQNNGVDPASAIPGITQDPARPSPAAVTAETPAVQTNIEKTPENPKHPISEKEGKDEDANEVQEIIQNEDAHEKIDEMDIVVTKEDLEMLKSLRERLTLLRRNWGLLPYSDS